MSEDISIQSNPLDDLEVMILPPQNPAADDARQARIQDVHAELESYRTALNHQAIVGITDRGGTIIGINDRFCAISQYSRAELIGQKHGIVNSGHHPRQFFTDLWRTIGRGSVWHGDICNRAKDGSHYWVDTTIVPRRDSSGRIIGYISVRYDITQRKQVEAALLEENRQRQRAELLLRDVIDALPNGISAYDDADKLVLFNRAFKTFYPQAAPAIVEGATFESILRFGVEQGQFLQAKDNMGGRDAWIEARLSDHRNPGKRLIQPLSDGRWLQVQETRSRSGHIVGVRTDITELKRAEGQIKRQAERDPLTGLHNRRAMLERLTRCLTPGRGVGTGRIGALLIMDLDDFKLVNDTLGHDAGDALLIEVSERLRRTVRKTDMVARLGGDEFALVISSLNSEADAVRIAEKLLKALLSPVQLGTRQIVPAASFGMALFPRDGLTAADLMKHADMALYQAKATGGSSLTVYSSALWRNAKRRAAMTEALKLAISRRQVEVALQPQVRFVDGRHTGFEALVRWTRRGRPVPPVELISVAEESGLIGPLGIYVADAAMAAMGRLRDAGFAPGMLAINIAAAQLKEPGFIRQFLALVTRHGLKPSEIEIEVTENVVLDRAADLIGQALREAYDAGIAVALDDFGTGYASLAHLKRFRLSRLKIDRSFIAEVTSNSEDAAITRAIISLAKSLDLEVVAEGIETDEQFQTLAGFGCDYAQGYLIARPLMPPDVEPYMARQQGAADAA